MIMFYWIYLSKDNSQRIIPKFIGFIEASWGKPEVSYIISILNLCKCIFACFTIFKLFINDIVFIDDIFEEILAFFYMFCLFTKLS
jgi:hypothetical protein